MVNGNRLPIKTRCVLNPVDRGEDWTYKFVGTSDWAGPFNSEAGCHAHAFLRVQDSRVPMRLEVKQMPLEMTPR